MKHGSLPVTSVKDHESGLGTFGINQCTGCGLFFTHPAPTAATLHHLYDNRSSTDFDPVDSRVVGVLKDWLSRRGLRRVVCALNGPPLVKVLDFGCGDGRSVRNLARLAPHAEVHGTDFGEEPPPSLEGTRGSNNSRITYLPYSEFLSRSDRYELIVLRHVLEHQTDPVSLLEDLSARLVPDGTIWIEVPSISSIWRRLLGQYWHLWYVPRHIFHFAPSTLTRVCRAAGLNDLTVRQIDMPLIGRSLRNRLAIDYSLPLLLLGALAYPMQVGVDRLFRTSSCLQVLCRRGSNPAGG